jgi:dynein heavy chain
VVNIYRFNRIYVKVKPLMDTLNAARASKAAADASLNAALGAVAEVRSQPEMGGMGRRRGGGSERHGEYVEI